MEKKSINLKLVIKMLTFTFLGNIWNKLGAIDCKEIYLKGNAYDFSVVYSSVDKSNILNIHKYLMIKNGV